MRLTNSYFLFTLAPSTHRRYGSRSPLACLLSYKVLNWYESLLGTNFKVDLYAPRYVLISTNVTLISRFYSNDGILTRHLKLLASLNWAQLCDFQLRVAVTYVAKCLSAQRWHAIPVYKLTDVSWMFLCLLAIRTDSDQPARMRRLTWIYTGPRYPKDGFPAAQLNLKMTSVGSLLL